MIAAANHSHRHCMVIGCHPVGQEARPGGSVPALTDAEQRRALVVAWGGLGLLLAVWGLVALLLG